MKKVIMLGMILALGALSSCGESIKDAVTSVSDTAKDAGTKVVDTAKDAGTKVVDTATDAIVADTTPTPVPDPASDVQ